MTTTVLIADPCKPSLVMTSEVIKDKIAGAIIIVTKTGEETLDALTREKPDLCVVDFDLPDADGPALIEAMRRVYSGPILMTAFPDTNVASAVNEMLFTSNDAGGWLSKPVDVEDLNSKLDLFLVQRHRLGKRFGSAIQTQLVGKAAGRGKRAPKVKGKIVNISMGGACIALDGSMKMKKAQEFMVTLAIPDDETPEKDTAAAKSKAPSKSPKTAKKPTPARGAKARETLTRVSLTETKVKAKVAWVGANGKVGIQFANLTDIQKKGLVGILRYAAESQA